MPGVFKVSFPMCKYGAPFKKPTTLLTNCPLLADLAGECGHRRHAEVLRGRVRVKHRGHETLANRTSLAGSYPTQLCETWSELVRPLMVDDQEKPGADGRRIERQLLEEAKRTNTAFPKLQKAELLEPGSLTRSLAASTPRPNSTADFCKGGDNNDVENSPRKRKRTLDSPIEVAASKRLRASELKPNTVQLCGVRLDCPAIRPPHG